MREGVGHLLSDLKYFSNFFMCDIWQETVGATPRFLPGGEIGD